jgi:hypothetical protein
MDTVAQLKKEAQEANGHYEKEYRRLFTSDGFTTFPKAEHDERVSALRGKKLRALRDIDTKAKALRKELMEEADLSTQFAPDKALSAGERSEVQSRLPVIQADVDAQSAGALAEQLQGILRSGSKAEQFAYWQTASRRNRQDKARAAEADGKGVYRGPRVTPLDGVLYELEAAVLAEETERREAAASSRVSGVDEVIGICYLGLNEASATSGRRTRSAAATPLALPPAPSQKTALPNSIVNDRGGPG